MKSLFRGIVSIVILAVAVVGAMFFVWPDWQEFVSLRGEVETRKNRLESGEKVLAHLKEIEKEIVLRQEDFAKADRAVPRDPGLPVLYEHIQELGNSSGLILTSIEGRQTNTQEGSITLEFKGVFTGSYQAVKNFLGETRRSARVLNVKKIALAADPQNPRELLVTVELVGYAAP